MNTLKFIAACAALTGAAAAFSHETQHPPRKATSSAMPAEQKAWGIAGQPRAVRRTIEIAAADDMSFTPSVIEVREGDTVRLRLKNRGKDLHELVLGTPAEIESHAALMKKHPTMEHDEPWMTHVQPGKTGEVVWHFNRAGDFDFACLVKDHYELGMAGRIRVLAARN